MWPLRHPDLFGRRRSAWVAVSLGSAFLLCLTVPAAGQSFNSGSTGSDGALDLSAVTPGTTIVFEPSSFTPPLDPEGDNVYHFTSIRIPEDVTVRLGAEQLGVAPVVWLATGPVEIAGTIDLTGEAGHHRYEVPRASRAGAGGYGGGGGGSSVRPHQFGNGPGGATQSARGAGHVLAEFGAAYGNDFLHPLLGGSGGAGGLFRTSPDRGPTGGGGAGGGALLVASSTSILLDGRIEADGGSGGCAGAPDTHGGGGSGGAIRLMAPRIAGTGSLSAIGRVSVCGVTSTNVTLPGSYGRIRLEAFRQEFRGTAEPASLFSTPGSVFSPASAPSVRIVRVAEIDVPPYPQASFFAPDVTLHNHSSVTLEIEARQIPPGTVVQITLQPETGSGLTVDSTPLAGSLEHSTATATVSVPYGFSRFLAKASWMP